MPKEKYSRSRHSPEFSEARARDVLGRLSKAAADGRGLTGEQDDLVENQVPDGVKRGSLEHALFLFLTVPSDRGTKSASLWNRAKRAYAQRSPLYNIDSIIAGQIGTAEIASLLASQLKPRYANALARYWYSNAVRLGQDFDQDPRRLFGSGQTAPEVYRLIRGFSGFGPKTGGMLLRAAVGLGWASAKQIEAVEIPVDIHDARITFLTGIMKLKDVHADGLSPQELATHAGPVRRFLTKVCANEGIEWPSVDRALWLIGSRGCVQKRCSECPLRDLCKIPAGLPLFAVH